MTKRKKEKPIEKNSKKAVKEIIEVSTEEVLPEEEIFTIEVLPESEVVFEEIVPATKSPVKQSFTKNDSDEVRKLHPREVEDFIRTIMKYHNITTIEQRDQLMELVKERIGNQTEEVVITRCFEMILDPLSIYFK